MLLHSKHTLEDDVSVLCIKTVAQLNYLSNQIEKFKYCDHEQSAQMKM